MTPIVVVGAFTARPGREAEARSAFEALVEPTHAEPGCILYALHQGADDPARLAFIERWNSREELETHLKSDHIAAVLQRADDLFAASDITVYDAIASDDSAKGSLVRHAGSVG